MNSRIDEVNNRIEELTESLSKAVDKINNLKKKLKDTKPISVGSEAISLKLDSMHLFDDIKKFKERHLNYILPTLKSKKLELLKEVEKIGNLEIHLEKTLKALHLDSLSLIVYPANLLKYDDLNKYEYKIRRIKNRLANMRDLIDTQVRML